MKRAFKDVHVYFPLKVLASLKRLTAQTRRSVTAEVVIAVERHIERQREQQSEREEIKRTIQHQTEAL